MPLKKIALLVLKVSVLISSVEKPMWYWSCSALINKEGVLISDPGLEKATLVFPTIKDVNKKQKMLCVITVRIKALFINIEVKWYK